MLMCVRSCSCVCPCSCARQVGACHLRLYTGPLSTLAEHAGCAGGTYLRGRRVRLVLLLPEDTLCTAEPPTRTHDAR